MEIAAFLSLRENYDGILCDGLIDAKPGCTLVTLLRGCCFSGGYPMILLCPHF